MQLTSFLTTLSLLGLTATTPIEPVSASRWDVNEGKPGSFFMCTEKQFQGDCTHVNLKMPECWNIRKPFRGNVKSLRPNEWRGEAAFQYECTVYDEPGCMGSGEVLRWPGATELGRSAWSVRCEYSDLEEYARFTKTPEGRVKALGLLFKEDV